MRDLMVLFSLDYCLQPPIVLYWCAFHTGLVRSSQSCFLSYFQFAIPTVLSSIYPEFTTHVVNDVTPVVSAYAT